jgi:hypothetical protein
VSGDPHQVDAGFIPVPILFQVTAVIALLSLVPLMFIKKKID